MFSSLARVGSRLLQSSARRVLAAPSLARHVASIPNPAPGFTCQAVMPDGAFQEVSLSNYEGKYVILFFYPLDFTFVCPTEITAFSDRAAEFEELGNSKILRCILTKINFTKSI